MSTKRGNTLRRIQERLSQLRDEVANLDYAPLGQEYKLQKASYLQNALIRHRFIAKYEKPEAKKVARRREASIRRFLDTDASNPVSFDYRDLDPDARRTFLGARNWLAEVLRDFRPTYRFAFPSREGAISAKGETDMFDKLVREDQWTCSVDALPYAAMVAYNTHAIKRVVRARFRHKWKLQHKTMMHRWYSEAIVKGQKPGRYAFTRMFSSLVEITPCRVTTVPKDNNWDRVITCEATWSMVAQLSLALDLREHLKKRTGIDITWWQDVHKALIRDASRATIDFSSASDRNAWSIVQQLFPKRVVKHLAALRSSCVVDGTEYHPLIMFAPMGAGNTFDVMTLTLLAYSRQFDPSSTVFGDDVILKASAANAFCAFTEKLNWKVNHNKSFIEGNFRESCGGFAALDEQKLLLSYDIRWPSDLQEAYITVNKLVRVRDAANGDLKILLCRGVEDLCSYLPCSTVLREDYTGRDLLDYVILDPETRIEHSHTKLPSVAVSLQGAALQRRLHIVVRQVSTPCVRTDVSHRHTHVTTACFLRAGCVTPLSAKFETRMEKVDAWSGTPINRIPIVTVL